MHCTCPAWLYWGYQYIGTKKDYAIEKETRAPVKRNPNLKGSVCKHLDNCLLILPWLATKISSDLTKQGTFKKTNNEN